MRINEEASDTANVSCIGFHHSAIAFCSNSLSAQDAPYSEEYMKQHDGGDRAEYLQELEHSDPLFYVPPVNDASFPVTNNTSAN